MAHKIAFIYGFGEGPWHGKQFKKRLQLANFEVVTDVTKADTVITHSAGGFFAPNLLDHQTIVFIGPPYWPGRSIYSQMIQKVWIDIRINGSRHPLFLFQKTAWNLVYIFGNPKRSKEIIRLNGQFDLPSALRHHRTIIIRNDLDTWLTPNLEPLRQLHTSLQINTIPGDHDDCWLHPDIYVDLIQSEL